MNPPLNPLQRRGIPLNQATNKFQDFPSMGGGRGGSNTLKDSGFSVWSFLLLMLIVITISCRREPEQLPTYFDATLTVADSIDQTGNYSGFNFLIFSRDNAAAAADTVFHAVTDSTGHISGVIDIEKEGVYPLQISRNGIDLVAMNLTIARNDTITFTGEFPGIQSSIKVDSRENRAMQVYQRVENGFERARFFIVNGQIPDSLIGAELQKWANLYWEVYENQKGTFASKFALEASMSLFDRVDKSQMFSKLNSAFDEELAYGLAMTLGKDYVAEEKGLEHTVQYLDSVRSLTEKEEIEKAIDQVIIKLYLDSARVETAKELLASYDSDYHKKDAEPSFWYKNMRYEVNNLAPGMDFPEFSFTTTEGDTVSNSAMLGTAYILEFTLMANELYQSQYDEATVIYQLYNPRGLEYFTIPFDQSSNTIIGFFQERDRFWSIAEPPSFSQSEFAEDFNIQYFPTRILIDREGKIVRKFVGEEFEDMIPEITKTLNK